jgi:hypothetical protein
MSKHLDLFEACRRELNPPEKGSPDRFASAVRYTAKRSRTRARNIATSATDCPKRVEFFAERAAKHLSLAA